MSKLGRFFVAGAAAPEAAARCAERCGGLIRHYNAAGLERTLAYSFGGMILIAIANTLPFMTLDIEGRIETANLITGAVELFDRGMYLLAAAVIATTILAPLIKVGSTIYVLLGLKMRRPPPRMPQVFRLVERLTPWAMIEVYMLGVFVAYVKLVDLASIHIGVALYALVTLMVTMTAANASINSDAVWEEMEHRGLVPMIPGALEGRRLSCHDCGLVLAAPAAPATCPRCGARLHRRRPNSLTRCAALVLAAVILYIPANVYPVMTIISFGSGFSQHHPRWRRGAADGRHVAAGPAGLLRQHHRPGAEARLPHLSDALGETQIALAPAGPHADVPDRGRGRTLVDDRHLHGLDPGGAGARRLDRDYRARRGRHLLLLRRGHHHDGGHELRPPADVGCGGSER